MVERQQNHRKALSPTFFRPGGAGEETGAPIDLVGRFLPPLRGEAGLGQDSGGSADASPPATIYRASSALEFRTASKGRLRSGGEPPLRLRWMAGTEGGVDLIGGSAVIKKVPH